MSEASGYKKFAAGAKDLMKVNKQAEEAALRIITDLSERDDVSKRWLAKAREHIEEGFMCINMAVLNTPDGHPPEDSQPAAPAG